MQRNGFAGELLEIMRRIWYWECYDPDTKKHYIDAVGDLNVINEKWMASLGPGQVRALQNPFIWGNEADTWRQADKLHDDPDYNAQACLVICEDGAELDKWTVYRTGRYLEAPDGDFPLYRGHKYRAYWDSRVPVLNPVKDPKPVLVYE